MRIDNLWKAGNLKDYAEFNVLELKAGHFDDFDGFSFSLQLFGVHLLALHFEKDEGYLVICDFMLTFY